MSVAAAAAAIDGDQERTETAGPGRPPRPLNGSYSSRRQSVSQESVQLVVGKS